MASTAQIKNQSGERLGFSKATGGVEGLSVFKAWVLLRGGVFPAIASGRRFCGLAAKIVRTGAGKLGTDGHLDSFRRIVFIRAAISSRFRTPFSYRRLANACAVR